jgi:hypothetical protein
MKTPHRHLMNTALSTVAVLLTVQTLCMSAPAGQKAQVMELMQEGSAHYLRREYKKAIGPYQKALDLEKQSRTLEQNLWRVLVDNLGMSYGITGDLKVAKETFEYGISEDSEYPMFYYNMACTRRDGQLGEGNRILKAGLRAERQHDSGREVSRSGQGFVVRAICRQ